MFVVVAIVALLAARSESGPYLWDKTTWVFLVANGVCDAINVLTFFLAMERTTVAIAVLSHYLAPVFVALGAPFVDGVRIRHARSAALAGLVGLAVVLRPWASGELPPGAWAGAGLGAVSAVMFAGNVLFSRLLIPRIGPGRTQGIHALIALVLLVPLALASDWSGVTPKGLLLVVTGATLVGGVASMLFIRGLSVVGSTVASTLTYLEPLVAVTVGVVVWNESLAPSSLLGALLIAGAGLYVVRASRTTSPPSPARVD